MKPRQRDEREAGSSIDMKPGENCIPGVFVGFVYGSVACSFARALFSPSLAYFCLFVCLFVSTVLVGLFFFHTAPFFAFPFIPFKNKTNKKVKERERE